MSKNTIVFLEAARHFKVTTPHSLHHGFRRYTFDAIREALPEATQDRILVSAIDEAVTIGIPTQKWTDLPVLPSDCFMHHNRFHPVIEEPSEKFGTTMKADENDVRDVAPEEMGEIVLAGWSVMHIGRCLAHIVPLLKWLGHRPERVLIVRSNFVGHNWYWMDWNEAETLAVRYLPMIRFDTLYDLNFRGIAGRAMKHCILAYPNPRKTVDVFFKMAQMGTYRPAFLALLEVISRRRFDDNRLDPCRSWKPAIEIWRHSVGGGSCWLKGVEDGLNFNRDANVSQGATVKSARSVAHWIGSGSLAPIIAPAFHTTPYPTQYLAAGRTHAVDFVSLEGGIPRLTDRGRMFLDMLPSKAKDIDAPIRWNDLKPEDATRADDWMARHFKMIKRAVQRRIPSEPSLSHTMNPAMDFPSNP